MEQKRIGGLAKLTGLAIGASALFGGSSGCMLPTYRVVENFDREIPKNVSGEGEFYKAWNTFYKTMDTKVLSKEEKSFIDEFEKMPYSEQYGVARDAIELKLVPHNKDFTRRDELLFFNLAKYQSRM